MKLTLLITINAILFIAFGIAFALYGPLMMAFFAIPEMTGIDVQAYWQMAAFVRMFGAALLGFGLLLWSIRSIIEGVAPEARRGILFALLLAYIIAAIVSITQQSSIWLSPAGWITTGVFVALILAYGYFLFAVKEPRQT